MKEIPGLSDVNSDLQITSPEVVVDIDRDRASALGVTADQIEDALYGAYGSRQVSDIYTPTNDYWVIMELLPQYQMDPAALHLLYVRSATENWSRSTRSPSPRSSRSALSQSHTWANCRR